jgi:hypothetical protein
MQVTLTALMPLLLAAWFVGEACTSSPARAAGEPGRAACSLLTKEVVMRFTPYDNRARDLVMLVPPTGDPVGRSGSECTYGGITLQVDPFPPAMLEKQRDQTWLSLNGVSDAAWFRDNGGRWGELYARSGNRVLTLQMNVPTGRTALSIQPNLVGLAKALLSDLK